MNKTTVELKEGIKVHFINTDLYKTDLTCLLMTTPLKRENVTKNALIPFMLRRGTEKLPNQYLINKELENMYGATFNCGIDKIGDNIVLKFLIESINNKYALNKDENILKSNIENLLDIVFNPIKNESNLNEEFLEVEKGNLKDVIESKIDDKDSYALESCISTMYGEEGFGIYKYGYIEDIDSITIEDVSNYYDWLVNNAKIDLYISSDAKQDELKNLIENNKNFEELNPRKENYILDSTNCNQNVEKVKEVKQVMDVTQGKLVIGLDICTQMENYRIVGLIYNSILGDGANSMIFQNVREKAGLAYSAKSTYYKQKGSIFIRCGIQVENYQKTVDLIKIQLDNIKNGNFLDEDVENAKRYLISGIKNVEEEQDTEIVYYIGQEISKTNLSIEEYMEKINNVTKEQVIEFANSIKINTIYYLTNAKEN